MQPRHVRHRLTPWWWPLALLAFAAALATLVAPASAQTLSSDATLRNLTLSEGRLSPAFNSATTTYMAAVGYTVPRVTFSPVTNDASATVAYTDGADQPLEDADSAAGQQVDLAEGENVIKVKVTAEDGNATETYTMTATRTEEDTSLSPASSDTAAAFPSTAVYRVTFTGEWDSAVTPDGVPGDAHFSIPIGAVHNSSVTFLRSQRMASAGIESMAELGSTRRLELEIAAAGENALSLLRGTGISATGSTTLTATLTTEHPRVTLTAMIGPSHDWFVGVSGMTLRDGSSRWLRALGVDLFPWDAGTEEGTDFAFSPDVATSPQGTIESIRGTGKFTTKRIASLSFTLQSVSTTRSVAENTAAGADIGEPVVSTDTSGAATYTLGGTSRLTTSWHEDVQLPAQPTGLTASPTSEAVSLEWDGPGDDSITGYQVLRQSRDGDAYGDDKGAPEFAVIADDTASADAEYRDSSVTPGTRYVYRIKARNAAGLSPWSSFANAETLTAPVIQAKDVVAKTDPTCPDDTPPTPTAVTIDAIPIVVSSTTAEYFVLYVSHVIDADTTVEIPVAVTRGAAGRRRSPRTWQRCPENATGWRSTWSPTQPTSTATASTTSPSSPTWGA